MAYWLFKTEPDEYGIDDLANTGDVPAPWDGIRNYQARNLLRDSVAVGDGVLIYHSSCKRVGVAGTGRVVTAGYPDPDQFNPESRYFDAKARTEAPRWFRVDIVFEQKFTEVIALADIKQRPELADMVLLKQGRLSVQPVTEAQWRVILSMA